MKDKKLTKREFKSWLMDDCTLHFLGLIQALMDQDLIDIANIESEGDGLIKEYCKLQGSLDTLQEIIITARDLAANKKEKSS